MEIIAMLDSHWDAVKLIYTQGMATGNATFQTEAPTWEQWNNGHLMHSRIVAINNKEVVGWAALSPVSTRLVYAGVAEVSIYIADDNKGKGIGNLVLKELIFQSEVNGIWTLQAGIFPENIASVTLHIKNGFKVIGTKEKIGKMKNVWRDNFFLERRSKIIGI
jgi:L-amino acid N-acyltransferase YncA